MSATMLPKSSIAPSEHVPSRASLQRWTHGLINRIVMMVDALAITLAPFIYWAASPSTSQSFTWLQAGAIVVITLIGFRIAMGWTSSYRVERYTQMRWSLTDICVGLSCASIPSAIILIAFLAPPIAQDRWLLGWIGASFSGPILGRYGARLFVHFIQKNLLLRCRVIVVGTGPEADTITERLRDSGIASEYQLLGVIDPITTKFARSYGSMADVVMEAVDLTEFAQNYAVDLVIIALPWERSAEIVALTRRLQWIAADVVVPFDLGGLNPQISQRMAFANSPVLQLMQRPFKGSQGIFKVMEDYVVAIVALLVTWPFMLVAAIAIWIEGSGPIFFCQPRVGFNSKPFMMYKFRTMTVDTTDDGSQGTKRDNQRITWVGRFLRRTSIDELPQLVNVLRGEMSIVGPRPHVSNMLVGAGVYSEVVQQYAARHRIKPGITGWAQVNGMRGGIDSVEKASRGADLDLYYVANWSPQLDIRIMVRTILAGLIGRNVF